MISNLAYSARCRFLDRSQCALDRFNLVDCLHEYRFAINIHGDDVLAHHNWEISESWLARYK